MTAAARPSSPVTPALRDIQAAVRVPLASVGDEMRSIVLADAPLVARVASHVMSMPGKMFRPTLVLLASAAEGRPESRATTLAAVIELVHLATLVHDDAVDHSVLRRGLPTVNVAFSEQVSVITGDFLYARALGALVALGDIQPIAVLTRATSEMTVGELRQLGTSNPLEFSEDDYIGLIGAKTASLMSAACEIGALAGSSRYQEPLREYGHSLGMAFQIVDDCIDFTEDAATTGKPKGLDVRERKVTLPLIAALRTMSRATRREVETVYAAASPSEAQAAHVAEIVLEEGGLDYARDRAAAYAGRSLDAIEEIPDTPAADSLRRAVDYVVERRA